MKWADYCVSKLSLNQFGRIENAICCEDHGESLGQSFERNRDWMMKEVLCGKTFCSITLGSDGLWKNIGSITYQEDAFEWYPLPQNTPRRKTFISYYHRDDQDSKELFAKLFSDLIISKSVNVGDIDAENGDAYIKQLIQRNYLSDTTVLIVLLGPNTKHRKHVDWEIAGALNLKVGDRYSGILGLKLPTHPDFGTGMHRPMELPSRLADNIKTGYALIRDFTEDRIKMQEYIEEAFQRRITYYDERNNTRIQMVNNKI